jgi:hypothetical protein
MQISSYIESIDKQLSSTLHKAGHSNCEFSWYLALQMTSTKPYNAKNESAIEHSLLYASMNMPSAPKPSLYVQDKHFSQYAKQAISLHSCKHPSLLIQFYNSLQPHSLHSSKEQQKLPIDVIENTSIFVQECLKGNDYIKKSTALGYNSSDNKQAFNANSSSDMFSPHNNLHECVSDLPSNDFVDATFASIEQAMAIIV